MSRRVLVTGSSGFIGTALTRRLREDGATAVTFDLLEGQDVRNESLVRHALRDIDAVVHLGAPSSIVRFNNREEEAHRTTVEGARNVVAHFRGRVVCPSTASIYASSERGSREDDEPSPTANCYAKAKLATEAVCLQSAADVRILRIFTGYGPDEWRKGDAASPVMHFLRDMRHGLPPRVHETGTQCRDFIYIDDIVDAIVLALNTEADERIFNIGTGKPTSFLEVVGAINDRLGGNVQPEFVQRPSGPRSVFADISRARKILGFAPKIDIRTGIDRTLAELDAAGVAGSVSVA